MFDTGAEGSGQLAVLGGTPVRPKPIASIVPTSEVTRERVIKLLESGHLSNYYNGIWARRFEDLFALYHGPNSHVVAVNSGTSALHLAVTAAEIGPGDEVIVPALCFVAAASAIVQNGGTPIICDAESDSLTLDVGLAESLIGPRTRAILAVHFWGYPSNSVALRDMCRARGLTFIEDCAQAVGGVADGGKVGTLSDFATYAFSVRKHIGCGEGGAVISHTGASHDRLRKLSNYGKGPDWDDYDSLGYSYRFPEFSAIVAIDRLARVDEEVAARRRAARRYREVTEECGLRVVPEPSWGSSAFFKCPMLLPAEKRNIRPQIVNAITAENVSCRVPHRPLYSIPWLAEYLRQRNAYRGESECPVAADAHGRLIEIETGPNLPFEEAQKTAAALMKVWNYYRD